MPSAFDSQALRAVESRDSSCLRSVETSASCLRAASEASKTCCSRAKIRFCRYSEDEERGDGARKGEEYRDAFSSSVLCRKAGAISAFEMTPAFASRR